MEQQLFTVLLQFTVIVLAARAASALFRKAGQPGVCGEMAAGLILGPSVFGRCFPHLFHTVFDASVGESITLFSQLGLVLLMFLIGMEFEFGHLRLYGRKAVSMSLVGVLAPFACGLLLAKLIYPWVGAGVSLLGFCLFTATAISITALPTLARILIEFGLNRTHIGVTAITAALLNDAAGWTILAVVDAMVQSHFHPLMAVRILLETIAFGAFLYFVVRPALKFWIRRVIKKEGARISFTTVAIVLALVFGAAMITNRIGIFSLFGAFLMGAILFDESEFRQAVGSVLSDIVYVLFVPIFFMYTGLRTDIGSMSDPFLWVACILVIVVAALAKGGVCMLVGRVSGFSWRDSASLGVLMNTRGLMELIVVNVGYDLGVIPKSMFFMLTMMAVATTYMTAPLLRKLTKVDALVPITPHVAERAQRAS